MPSPNEQIRLRRKLSIRKRVHGTTERPRLSVFRSAKHIYAQVIDDTTSSTLVSASTLVKELAGENDKTKREMAELVGATIAKACLAKGITMSCSTATATSTTVGSRPSPTARAPVGSTSSPTGSSDDRH
jgi:large subunit ribosomal protein L18